MIHYNKLVRDKIIDNIKKDNKECNFIIVENDVLKKYLQIKLKEEVEEYLDAKSNKNSVEELSDIFEVIKSLLKFHDSNIEDLLKVADLKKSKNGGFDKGIVLLSVED